MANDAMSWSQPVDIAPGSDPTLAGGLRGLFLLSNEGGSYRAREYNGPGSAPRRP